MREALLHNLGPRRSRIARPSRIFLIFGQSLNKTSIGLFFVANFLLVVDVDARELALLEVYSMTEAALILPDLTSRFCDGKCSREA